MTACLVWATMPDAAEAERIGRSLVEERLAAAANVLPGLSSFHWWDGAVWSGAEGLLVLKTRRDLAERVVQRVTALHGYVCPGVVILPIDGGNQPYLDWIAAETRPG